MTARESHVDAAELVRTNRVHGSVFTDASIFQTELEKIWYRTWVYVGHESEIPNANDFIAKSLGPQPVIMTRDRNGIVHLLQNRCSHRGNVVCNKQKGNTGHFMCPYHRWTFSNTGDLVGYASPAGYRGNPEATKSKLGLGKIPRVASYRGFVFGSFSESGPSLEQHL